MAWFSTCCRVLRQACAAPSVAAATKPGWSPASATCAQAHTRCLLRGFCSASDSSGDGSSAGTTETKHDDGKKVADGGGRAQSPQGESPGQGQAGSATDAPPAPVPEATVVEPATGKDAYDDAFPEVDMQPFPYPLLREHPQLEVMADPRTVVDWNGFMTLWAASHSLSLRKEQELEDNKDRQAASSDVQKHLKPDGSLDYAYDNTNEPIYDTRVWLHMYESPDGLKPTFCRRTGDAHYMYDFTGFKHWRVEQNALLSDEAKCLMFKLWNSDRELWTPESLATLFRIRVQRAIGVVKIKEQEFMHAEFCIEVLNELQRIFGLDPSPTLKDIERMDRMYTPEHLSAWFQPWIRLYELLPLMIDPESAALKGVDGGADGEALEAVAESAEQPGDTGAMDFSGGGADAAGGAASGGVGADEALDDGEGEGDEDAETETESEGGPGATDAASEQAGDKPAAQTEKKKLSADEAEKVIALHNILVRAGNNEARHIATHDDVWRCVYHMGAHERFVPNIKTMPDFREQPVSSVDVAHPLEYEQRVKFLEEAQDQAEIEEFKRNLDWSMGETGSTIQRASRRRGVRGSTLPSKPEEGWSILVTPLMEAGQRGKPFIAKPDGSRRELTNDEALYLEYFKREPKIFSRPRRHAPYTNETLHMFTQRKPNPRHDLYNPPYEGTNKHKTPTSGPSQRTVRKRKAAKRKLKHETDRQLAGTRL